MPRNSNGPIDPENPYRRKSPYRQMDNDPETSKDADATYNTLDQLVEMLSRAPTYKGPFRVNFDPIGYPKTGFNVASGWNNGHPFGASIFGSGATWEQIKGVSPFKSYGGKHSGVTKRAKSDMCKCGSGMMKSMCKCGGMGKSMLKANNPIDPENPYRRKSVTRQMDNDPETSRNARRSYASLDAIERELSGWQKEAFPNTKMTINFDVVGTPKTGFLIPTGPDKGSMRISSSGSPDKPYPSRGSAARKRMSNVQKDSGGGDYVPRYDFQAYPKKKSGYGTNRSMYKANQNPNQRTPVPGAPPKQIMQSGFNGAAQAVMAQNKPYQAPFSRSPRPMETPNMSYNRTPVANATKRMYKADDKNKNTDWASKLSGAAVDFVLQNKSVIERKAKEFSDQGFNYVNQNKSRIGRGARDLTERGIDFLAANKANIERGAKDISDKAFDYARRNKSGIGQSVERMTNQGIDYAIRSKSDIERGAKNYSDQGFDYLRRSKGEIGRQASNLVNNAMGRTTKRAGAMSKSLQSKRKNNKYF